MLTDQQDAYGHILYDYLHGRPSFEIDERDDGMVAWSGGPTDYFAPFADWPAHERQAMDHVHGRVLDIGAGAGRCCLHLQERGHPVLATDNSPLAIRTCRDRGVKHAQVVPITRLSARLGTFDTLLMLGNNFGLFGSFRRARWLLRRFRGFTSPDARLIAESTDPYQTDAPEHLAYHRWNLRRGRMPGQIRLRIRYRTYRTPWFDYLLVSPAEMQEILAGTGWAVQEFIPSPGPS
ncbi:MAG: class I SAM-dependent methyltransferase, partial [Armatimonadetes bacterium]|nr:class I SAM-dependent methyltransferase [Armatimonadota bacterium]